MTPSDKPTRCSHLGAGSTALAVWMSCFGAGAAIARQGATSADLPTVAATQGDDSHGLEVASKFITGCAFSCGNPPAGPGCGCSSSTFHTPSAWSSKQLHLENPNMDYSRFYVDKTVTGGMDDSPGDGVEGSRILFYAGEGRPQAFMADFFDSMVDLSSFSVGDGEARYLFMMACNLFAHGPRDLSSTGPDFRHPERFDAFRVHHGQSWHDGDYMADVFSRWGARYGTAPALRSPLNPRLRLACGGSSRIGAGEYPTHLFWYYRRVVGLPPADAWMVGLYEPDEYKPLCTSRGESFLASGLADHRFEKEPLAAERPGHPGEIYIEYPVQGDAHEPFDQAAFLRVPARSIAAASTPEEAPILPVIQVGPASLPGALHGLNFSATPALAYGFHGGSVSALIPDLAQSFAQPGPPGPAPVVRGQDLCLQRHELNGSVMLSWRLPVSDRQPFSTEQRAVDQASNALLAGVLDLFQQPVPADAHDDTTRIVPHESLAIQMYIDAVPADVPAGSEKLVRTKGCLYQRQTTAVHYQGHDVPIFGEGGEHFVARCPHAWLRLAPSAPGDGPSRGVCQRTDAPLVSFVYNDRVVRGTRASSQKTASEAESEARAKLGHLARPGTAYERVGLRWGYRAAPAHCSQKEMYLVYELEFASKNRAFDGTALISVEVAAHDLGGKDSIEDTWTCSAEVAPE